MTLKYWRDGKERKAKVEIGELEKAEDTGLLAENKTKEPEAQKSTDTTIESVGLTVTDIASIDRKNFNVPNDVDGVLVMKSDPRGEAAKRGLTTGDVIVEADQQPVIDPKALADIFDKAKKEEKSHVLLLVNREGDVRFVALKLEDK